MIINGKSAAAALVKARAAMKSTVTRDARANYGKYATLAAVMEAISPALTDNGLALVQEAELGDGMVTICTALVHESGETIEFVPLTMPVTQRTPQAVGSAITYGRRYQLTAVFGLAPDDDDGAEASKSPQERTNGQQAAQPTAQRQKAPQRPATRPTANVDNAAEVDPDGPDNTPAHQRFWGIGQSVFGPDWDTGARAWVVERWTAKHTPQSIRISSSKLSDDEKDALADDMHQYASELQKLWQKVKPHRVMKEAA